MVRRRAQPDVSRQRREVIESCLAEALIDSVRDEKHIIERSQCLRKRAHSRASALQIRFALNSDDLTGVETGGDDVVSAPAAVATLRVSAGMITGSAIVDIGREVDTRTAALRGARADTTRLTLSELADLVGQARLAAASSSAAAAVRRIRGGHDAGVAAKCRVGRASTAAVLTELSGLARDAAAAAICGVGGQIRADEGAFAEAFAAGKSISNAAAEQPTREEAWENSESRESRSDLGE